MTYTRDSLLTELNKAPSHATHVLTQESFVIKGSSREAKTDFVRQMKVHGSLIPSDSDVDKWIENELVVRAKAKAKTVMHSYNQSLTSFSFTLLQARLDACILNPLYSDKNIEEWEDKLIFISTLSNFPIMSGEEIVGYLLGEIESAFQLNADGTAQLIKLATNSKLIEKIISGEVAVNKVSMDKTDQAISLSKENIKQLDIKAGGYEDKKLNEEKKQNDLKDHDLKFKISEFNALLHKFKSYRVWFSLRPDTFSNDYLLKKSKNKFLHQCLQPTLNTNIPLMAIASNAVNNNFLRDIQYNLKINGAQLTKEIKAVNSSTVNMLLQRYFGSQGQLINDAYNRLTKYLVKLFTEYDQQSTFKLKIEESSSLFSTAMEGNIYIQNEKVYFAITCKEFCLVDAANNTMLAMIYGNTRLLFQLDNTDFILIKAVVKNPVIYNVFFGICLSVPLLVQPECIENLTNIASLYYTLFNDDRYIPSQLDTFITFFYEESKKLALVAKSMAGDGKAIRSKEAEIANNLGDVFAREAIKLYRHHQSKDARKAMVNESKSNCLSALDSVQYSSLTRRRNDLGRVIALNILVAICTCCISVLIGLIKWSFTGSPLFFETNKMSDMLDHARHSIVNDQLFPAVSRAWRLSISPNLSTNAASQQSMRLSP